MADGLLAAHAALGEPSRCTWRAGWWSRRCDDFWDRAAARFSTSSDEHDRTVARPRGLVDNATPSANSLGADVLQRLALLTGDEALARRGRVDPARRCAGPRAPAERLRPDAVRGRSAARRADRRRRGRASRLARGSWRCARPPAAPYAPDLVLTALWRGRARTPTWPLYAGKGARGGAATAYACRGYACDEPTVGPGRGWPSRWRR